MLAHWDPFSEMSRLHDRVFGRSAALNGDYAWKPAVDIYEDEKLFHVDVEVPGVKPEDINVNVENNVLTITGERKLEAADQRDGYHRVERFYGSFSRSFALTDKVEQSHHHLSVARIHPRTDHPDLRRDAGLDDTND
jgi:HSP20 family protein